MNEDQQEELEALNSIYMDEIVMTGDAAFKMTLWPDDDEHNVGCRLEVVFPTDYPNEPPEITLNPLLNLYEINTISAEVDEVVASCIGSAMMFGVIEKIKEILLGKNLVQESAHDSMVKKEAVEEAIRKAEAEDIELVKSNQWTEITPEVFE